MTDFWSRPLTSAAGNMISQEEANKRREEAKKTWTKAKPVHLARWLVISVALLGLAVLCHVLWLDVGRPIGEENLWYSKSFEWWQTILFAGFGLSSAVVLVAVCNQQGVKPKVWYDILGHASMVAMIIIAFYVGLTLIVSAQHRPDEGWVLAQLGSETKVGWSYVYDTGKQAQVNLDPSLQAPVQSNTGEFGLVHLVPAGDHLWKVELLPQQ